MSSDRYSTVNILNQHFLLDGFLLVLENGSGAVLSGGFILKGKEETTDINWKMLWLVNMSNWSIKEKNQSIYPSGAGFNMTLFAMKQIKNLFGKSMNLIFTSYYLQYSLYSQQYQI